jgi:hypothetical protein
VFNLSRIYKYIEITSTPMFEYNRYIIAFLSFMINDKIILIDKPDNLEKATTPFIFFPLVSLTQFFFIHPSRVINGSCCLKPKEQRSRILY